MTEPRYVLRSVRGPSTSVDGEDWDRPDPVDRYGCFICGQPTDELSFDEYVDVTFEFDAPHGVTLTGAHRECLRGIASMSVDHQDRPTPPPRSAVDRTSPPIDFPIYGLDQTWTGPRWFSFAAGRAGEPPEYVDLSHGPLRTWKSDDQSSAKVTSFALENLRPVSSAGQHTAEMSDHQLIGERVLLTLVNVAPTPGMATNQRRRFWRRILPEFVEARAAHPEAWTRATWSLDGRPLEASIISFAGLWAGIALVSAKSGIGVVARNVNPETLALTTISDGSDYHFSLNAPLTQELRDLALRAEFGDDAVDAYYEDDEDEPEVPMHEDLAPFVQPDEPS